MDCAVAGVDALVGKGEGILMFAGQGRGRVVVCVICGEKRRGWGLVAVAMDAV